MERVEPSVPAPKERLRRIRRKATTPVGEKGDAAFKCRIRRIPEVAVMYRLVREYGLREEAFKLLVLNALNQEQTRKVVKLLAATPLAS